MEVALEGKCDNYPAAAKDQNFTYTLDSKVINSRTNYCVGKIINR